MARSTGESRRYVVLAVQIGVTGHDPLFAEKTSVCGGAGLIVVVTIVRKNPPKRVVAGNKVTQEFSLRRLAWYRRSE